MESFYFTIVFIILFLFRFRFRFRFREQIGPAWCTDMYIVEKELDIHPFTRNTSLYLLRDIYIYMLFTLPCYLLSSQYMYFSDTVLFVTKPRKHRTILLESQSHPGKIQQIVLSRRFKLFNAGQYIHDLNKRNASIRSNQWQKCMNVNTKEYLSN